ncbi:periplasmic tail-specific proteinase [Blastopirellula marina DSM 3645]|uniref:Periplasmic tail-specific proteinase n=1 Tax=Blastopirellula marina DSM 3645 TaxID=314230 RepID=A3ZZQ5_9BACT|nr:periplasmic tail-specific proteinase [Blastopirellula marina DSM 3645]
MHPTTVTRNSWRRPGALRVLTFASFLFSAIFVCLPDQSSAQLAPKVSERRVAFAVTQLMKKDHLSNHPIDDEMSQRAFDQFLKTLDPLKLYFYQSDVDEFAANRDKLDDMVNAGDVSFSRTVFDRFLKRVNERVAMVDRVLAADLDFEKKEMFITDADKVQYPKNEAEAYDRWRQRVKYDILSEKADDKTPEEAQEKIHRRYESFARRMSQTSGDELLEMFLTSMTSSFDPHTTYMSPSTLENFNISMRLQLDGIGAALLSEDGVVKVTKVIPGGAADKHGKLHPEDTIVTVGQGENGEMVDVVDMKLNDVVNLIRGKAGTVVRLGVKAKGTGETTIYNVTRAKIELKDSEARGEVIDHKTDDGRTLRVGWIDLPSFYMDMDAARRGLGDFKSTTRDVRKLLDDFNDQEVQAVVLDLRRNGGGSLTEAINLTGLFIDQGPVVQVKDSSGNIQAYDDTDRGMVWKGPLVVLTSKLSASASEILAGAIQDYKRGIIVGDQATHGKGTVQSLLDLGSQLFPVPNPPNYGALKITMQQFYRPNGESTQRRGVEADVVLPWITTHMDIGEGDLDYAIAWDKIPQAQYTLYNMVDPNLLKQLQTDVNDRIGQSEDFQKVNKNIERYVVQKNRKAVNLNEAEYLAERKELDKEKTEEDTFKEDTENTDEVVKKDFYFDEVIDVTSDYVKLLEQGRVAARQ